MDGYRAEDYEAGALAALDYLTDEGEQYEDISMRIAEKIGADIEAHRDRLRGAVDTLRERVMALGGMRRTDQGAFWIDRDDVLRLLDEIGERP